MLIKDILFFLHRCRRNQWLSTPQIKRIQQKKMRRLIHHAYENVPYYRHLFDSAGVHPKEILTIEDLKRIPITTKSELQKCDREITAKNISPDNCISRRTAGSTGEPFHLIYEKKDRLMVDLFWTRALMENGVKWWHKQAYIKAPEEFFQPEKYWFQSYGIWRKVHISCYENVEAQIDFIQRERPHFLGGYNKALVLLAKAIDSLRVNVHKPKIIGGSSELLSDKGRELINQVFGVRMINLYGAIEVGLIGWECSMQEGLHINIDSVIVEFLNSNGKEVLPGQRGEIVCTGLYSYAMPFIRYKLGDVGIYTDELCSCGRGLPLIKLIEGRDNDLVRLRGGRILAPFIFDTHIEEVETELGILKYLVIQKTEATFVILLVTTKIVHDEVVIRKIRSIFLEVLGCDNVIDVQIVDEIPRDKSGKQRAVISEVTQQDFE